VCTLLTAPVALLCFAVRRVTVSTTILGERVSSPIAIAPTAMQRMAHPEGETATARGENDFDAGGAENVHARRERCCEALCAHGLLVRFLFDSAAAASVGTLMCLSSLSTTNLTALAAAVPNGLRWFQLYIYKVRQPTGARLVVTRDRGPSATLYSREIHMTLRY